MKTNILKCVENYKTTFDYNVCVMFLKYIGLIHELIDSIAENIVIQKESYLKHIMIKGIKNTTYIYTYLLLYTKNMELTVYHTQKAILYYVEFIGQLGEDRDNLLKLNSTDATLFIYKKTIFDIDDDFRKEYIETNEMKEKMTLLRIYMDVYNNSISHYINVCDLKNNNLNVLRKVIFTKFYSIVELLINTSTICNKNKRSEYDEVSKINIIIGEFNKYYKYQFISDNYLSVIEFIIKKNLKKPINIDTFQEKMNDSQIENRLENLSVCKIGNYLSLSL